MTTSADWLRYFEHNRSSLLDIPWHIGAELTPSERAAIERSVQEFQRGESSEGRHFVKYAKRYAEQTGDADYVPALRLFVAEEQRHARDLGRFLAMNGIPLLQRTATDSVFRALRHFAGTLEITIAVLITAEVIAQVYYAALREATGSAILRRLCEQILRDEQRHVEFQAQQLEKLRARRSPLLHWLTMAAQRVLFLGTCPVVWLVHHDAFRAGGYDFRLFWLSAWVRFELAFTTARPLAHPELTP